MKGLTGEDQKGAKPPASAKSSPPVSGSSGIKRGPGRPPGPTSKRPKLGETRTSGVKGNRSLKFRLVRPECQVFIKETRADIFDLFCKC